jgi:MFS family permease
VAYLLIALAVLASALGPRGQRPVNAAMLAVGIFACAFFGLRGIGHPWLAPAVAVVAAVLGMMFGAIAETWATAVLVAGLFAAPVGAAVAALKRPWSPFAAVAGSIGLFLGVTRKRKLQIFLPPLFAAAFAALGAAIGWGPNRRGAVLWRLLDVDWVLGLAAALAVPLVVLAVKRERWRRAKLEARTKEMDDEDLKRKIAERQPDYERAARELESGSEGEGGGTLPQSE